MTTYECVGNQDLCCTHVNRNYHSVTMYLSINSSGRVASARCSWCGCQVPIDSYLMEEVRKGVFTTIWNGNGVEETMLPLPKGWMKYRGGYVPQEEE